MSPEQEHAWAQWLATRPQAVQRLAEKYPPGTRFRCHGRIMHTISYEEYANRTVGLGVSATNPGENYALAVATRETVCACCLPQLDTLRIE